MRNHGEKIKDMSRSVLPSKGRKGARDNRRIIHGRDLVKTLAATGRAPRDPAVPGVRGRGAAPGSVG